MTLYNYNVTQNQQKISYEDVIKLLSKKHLTCKETEMIVEYMQKTVHREVQKWKENAKKYNIEMMDLIQAGNIGLIKAIKKCAGKKNKNFFSYAKSYIKSYIEAEFYSHTFYTRYFYKKFISYKKKDKSANLELFPVVVFSDILTENDDEGKLTIENMIYSSEENLLQDYEVENLLNILSSNKNFHPDAKQIIELRYGIGKHTNSKPLSFSKIGKILNLSKEGVRKILKKTILELKKILI